MTQGPRLARSFLFSRKTKKDDNGTVRANIWATTLQQKACTQERVDDDINVLPRLFARGRPLVPAGCDIIAMQSALVRLSLQQTWVETQLRVNPASVEPRWFWHDLLKNRFDTRCPELESRAFRYIFWKRNIFYPYINGACPSWKLAVWKKYTKFYREMLPIPYCMGFLGLSRTVCSGSGHPISEHRLVHCATDIIAVCETLRRGPRNKKRTIVSLFD